MGRKTGKGRRLPYGGKNQSESHPEWERESAGGGGKAYGVAENLRGDRQGVRGGVKFPRRTNTHGVEELPRGGETSGVPREGNVVLGANGKGARRRRKLPIHLGHQWDHHNQAHRGHGEKTVSGGITERNTGQGRKREGRGITGEYEEEFQWRRRRQDQAQCIRAEQVWLTGAKGDGGQHSHHRAPRERGRPQRYHGDRGHKKNGDRDKGTGQAVRAPRARPPRGIRG